MVRIQLSALVGALLVGLLGWLRNDSSMLDWAAFFFLVDLVLLMLLRRDFKDAGLV